MVIREIDRRPDRIGIHLTEPIFSDPELRTALRQVGSRHPWATYVASIGLFVVKRPVDVAELPTKKERSRLNRRAMQLRREIISQMRILGRIQS